MRAWKAVFWVDVAFIERQFIVNQCKDLGIAETLIHELKNLVIETGSNALHARVTVRAIWHIG
jgi:hypothetical protein